MPELNKRLKPIITRHSSSILLHPDGSIDEDTLEFLLYEVSSKMLPSNTKIITTHEKRVKGFDPDHPEWVKVNRIVTVDYLLKTYKEIYNRNYTLPTIEEIEQKQKDEFKRYPRGY